MLYDEILNIHNGTPNGVLCIIVNTKGSTPRKVGAKMIVYDNGKISGTIGGGELERKVIENALTINETKQPQLFRYDLLHQLGMCCGGTVDIYIEPIMKKNKLYIFGAGHTGQALAMFSAKFNFMTVLIDDRKQYIDNCELVDVNKMHLPFDQALNMLPFNEQTYICIMTYSHPIDRDILAYCITKPYAYLGMIGSQRKTEMTKKMFGEGLNISIDELEKVDMPMGIDIGAETPEEIAISILSKMIAVKNKSSIWEKELH